MIRVVDSSAIIALLNREAGWERAEAEIPDGIVSSLIYAEVITHLTLKRTQQPGASEAWNTIQLPVHPFDQEQALATGLLAPLTKPFGLSLADRACLVLARQLGAPVVTADRAWAKLDLGIDIRVIR